MGCSRGEEKKRLRRLEQSGTFRACSRVISNWSLVGLILEFNHKLTKNQKPSIREQAQKVSLCSKRRRRETHNSSTPPHEIPVSSTL